MSGVDNTNGRYDWGAMESTVRGVKLLTFRDITKGAKKNAMSRSKRRVRRRTQQRRG